MKQGGNLVKPTNRIGGNLASIDCAWEWVFKTFTVEKWERSDHSEQKELKKEQVITCSFFSSGDDLLSQAASRQVSSALQSLTTVFGMGTGVTSAS